MVLNALDNRWGCLRPDKCWWYYIDFKWDANGKWKYKKVRDTPGSIEIPDEKQIPRIIKRQVTNIGTEGLGVYLAPDGTNTQQLETMIQKAQK